MQIKLKTMYVFVPTSHSPKVIDYLNSSWIIISKIIKIIVAKTRIDILYLKGRIH